MGQLRSNHIDFLLGLLDQEHTKIESDLDHLPNVTDSLRKMIEKAIQDRMSLIEEVTAILEE